MRIISGRAGGIRLTAPEGNAVRPTEDRVKESMFSTLGDVTGRVVLDLFAGSGALGLEALSRGAAQVYGFELERRHCEAIRRNVSAVERALGVSGGYELRQGDASSVARLLPAGVQPDLVLADPPYETAAGRYGWRELGLDEGRSSRLARGARLGRGRGSAHRPPWSPGSRWRLLRTRSYGIRAVSFAVLEEEGVGDA